MDDELREAIAAVRGSTGLNEKLAPGRHGEVGTWRRTFGPGRHDPRPWASERAGRDGEHDPRSRHEGGRRVVFDGDCAAWVVEVVGGALTVERWAWSDGAPVRGDIATVASDWGSSEVYVAKVGEHGRLESLSRGWRQAEEREPDDERFLDELLAGAAALTPDHVVYDARIHSYAPRLSPNHEIESLLPAALERATVAAVAAAGIARPFVVDLRPGPYGAFRPFGLVGGERFRARMVALSPEPEAAVSALVRAEPPDGARFDLVDWLDDASARLCRELTAAIGPTGNLGNDDRKRASDVLDRLGRELAARLNQRSWPDAAAPFLALVHIGAPVHEVDPYALAAAAVGGERVAQFRTSIQPGSKLTPPPPSARRDRGSLERLLGQRGLGPHAHRLAHDVAERALRVRAVDQAASRLGGDGLLPPGASWPHGDCDRPLTFLAGVSLRELPERGPLPSAGWLLFFADIDIGEGEGLIDEATNELGAPARLVVLPGGTDPVPATPPAALQYVLSERRVRFEPQLTLPDGWDAGRHLHLDPAEEDAYSAVARWLRYGEHGWSLDDPDHWILGAVTGVQGTWPDADTVLLLHLSWDETLGLEYADSGSIQFRIPRRALAAGDWTATKIHAESH